MSIQDPSSAIPNLRELLTSARNLAAKAQNDYNAYDARVREEAAAGIEPKAEEYFAASEFANTSLDAFAQALDSIPDSDFAIEAKTSDGRALMVNASAQQPGYFQLTRFGSDGAPWGDTNFPTRQQATKEFLNEADLKTVKDFGGLIIGEAPVAQEKSPLQIEIEELRSWFGSSKIQDVYGRPLATYHGSPKAGLDRIIGGWFSEDPAATREFGSNMYTAFLSIQNPAYHDGFFGDSDLVREYNAMNGTDLSVEELEDGDGVSLKDAAVSGGPFTRWLIAKGYDGVSVYDDSNAVAAMAYVPFSPDQVRLVSQISPAAIEGFKVGSIGPDQNSKGAAIADSASGVERFYKWFDDSKIVDDEGRPLVLYRGLIGQNEIPSDALGATPRKDYAVFVTPSAPLAATYANPDPDSKDVGAIVPVYVKAAKLVEFPTTPSRFGGNSFDKFEFDRRARSLMPGVVLVARQVNDTGPRASTVIDPERLYSYATDVYAFGPGTETHPAVGHFIAERLDHVIAHDFSMNEPAATESILDADVVRNSKGVPVAATKEAQQAFLSWFRNGVTDDLGRPLVLYHGTTADIELFDLKYSGSDGIAYDTPALFTTPDTVLASDYALNKLNRPIADAYREFQAFKNENPGIYDDDYETAYGKVKAAFAANNAEGIREHGIGANVIPLYAAGDYHTYDGQGNRFMQVMPKAIAEAMAAGKDGVVVRNVIDHASPSTDYPSKIVVTFNAGNLKSALSNDGSFNQNDHRIAHDIPIDPSNSYDSAKVGKINALAIAAYEKLSLNAKDAVDSWNVNWSTGKLEQAFKLKNPLYDEIEEAFRPVRHAIKMAYGESLTLYRGERYFDDSVKKDRELYSWTLDKVLAQRFASKGRRMPAQIPDADIDRAVAAYERTGFVSYRGKKYLRDRSSPEYFGIYDSGNSMVTDGDDLREHLKSIQSDLVEMAKDVLMGGQVHTQSINVDDIRWIPVNGNLSQQEFIVTHDPARVLRHDIESLMRDNSVSRLSEAAQKGLKTHLQSMKAATMGQVARGNPSSEASSEWGSVRSNPIDRGPETVRESLQDARATGLLKPAVVDFALWALEQSPDLAQDLAIAIRPTSAILTAGNFNSATKVMTLFADRANDTTAVHEMLHNTERYLSAEVKDGILQAWLQAYMTAWAKAGAETRAALDDMLIMDSDGKAFSRVLSAFKTGKLKYREHYQLSNPSEFWAVNATNLLSEKYAAKDSWRATAKRWLSGLIAKAKEWFGIGKESAIVKGLESVLSGTAKAPASKMLMQLTGSFNDISDMKQEIETLQESLRASESKTIGLHRDSPLRQTLIEESAGYRKRLWELTGDAYGKPKTKRPKAPDDDLLTAEYASPDEIPKEVLAWVSRSSVINGDATDAVRWSRIIDTLEDDRYPEGERITFYRAVDRDYDDVREGDWITTDLAYAEEHNARWLGGKGHIIEITVDGADVLMSPSGNYEEAIYAPREYSGPLNEIANDMIAAPTQMTPAFLNWFAGSAAVHPNGSPLVLYHGTHGDFDQFDTAMFGTMDHGTVGYGIYATASRELASGYARSNQADGDAHMGGNVMPLYVSIKNPIGFDDAMRVKQAIIAQKRIDGVSDKDLEKEIGSLLTNTLKSMGHDGVSPTSGEWPGVGNSWTVFNPKQVKSALGNNGNYSTVDASIINDIPATSQVQTSSFKEWFGQSGVTNADGSPKIVFHATDSKFSEFTVPELGFHFAEREDLAHNAARKGGKTRTQAMEVFLSIQNPVEITGQKNGFTAFRLLDDLMERGLLDDDSYNDFMDEYEVLEVNDEDLDDLEYRHAINEFTVRVAEHIGADGFRYWNEFDSGEGVDPDWSYIALKPSQIKSAYLNNGEFSVHSNHIAHDIPVDPEKNPPVSSKVEEAEAIIAEYDDEDLMLLFHSGDASIDEDLKSFVEPQTGEWLKEVLAGATDCEEHIEQIMEADPVAFFSTSPTWVAVKAARAAGKHVTEVDVEDIRTHGQLCIILADRSRSTSLYQADGGRGHAVHYFDISDVLYELPFGVEPNDLFSFDGFVPEITLTGDDLVEFLLRNYPGPTLKAALAAGEIDEHGRRVSAPPVVTVTAYHGTNTEFDLFNTDSVCEVDKKRLGAYFTTNQRYAAAYGNRVVEAALTVSNPFDITGMDAAAVIKKLPISDRLKMELRSAFKGNDYSQYGLLETAQREDLRKSLESLGHDCIKYSEGCGDAYIAFKAQNIAIKAVTVRSPKAPTDDEATIISARNALEIIENERKLQIRKRP